MQRVVIDEPYKFVPPVYSDWWPTAVLRFILRRNLRKLYGVHSVECRNVERLKASLAAGHSILLTPNHSHLADPMALGVLGMEAGCHVFAMASWHVFKHSAFQTFMTRRMGAFSILREGNDRQAIETAIDILLAPPPFNCVSRRRDDTSQRSSGRDDGRPFLHRAAGGETSKKEDKPGGIVIHPIAIRYAFNGDLAAAITPDLEAVEKGLSWQPQRHLSLVERITKIGQAFLTLKEIEFLGGPGNGNIYERAEKLVEEVLSRLESQWHIADTSGNTMVRVKRLRTAILPDLIDGKISTAERESRWRDLAAAYYAQQISHYPRDYVLREKNLPERVVETVERLQEDFTDAYRIHGPLHAVIQVGEAIPVGTQRIRDEAGDPIMAEIRHQLQTMIDELAAERTPV